MMECILGLRKIYSSHAHLDDWDIISFAHYLLMISLICGDFRCCVEHTFLHTSYTVDVIHEVMHS